MITHAGTDDMVSGRIEPAVDGHIVLSIPGTEYQLHLVWTGGSQPAKPGRMRGTIHARALRMHPARAGGRFIEPIQGMPRIVQGAVLALDSANGRLLIDAAAPIWVTPPADQHLAGLQRGQLMNFYVESGSHFQSEAAAVAHR